jgi:hypothetical protein
MRTLPFAVSLTLLMLGILSPASGQSPRDWVLEGIDHFNDGRYDEAGKAFREADVAKPDDLCIAFNRACAAAAAQDTEKAVELFQKAALSRDQGLAVGARYNLGSLAAAQGRAVFGAQPEEAAPETRQEGLEHLHRAVRHFREVLSLEKDHEEARYNLELIRLWIKHMEAVWKERDRQKQRDEMDLLQFLDMIEARQIALRTLTRVLSDEKDSPKRRQALKDTEREQRALLDEIEPLKQKMEEALMGQAQAAAQGGQPGQPQQPGQPGQGAPDPEEIAEALEMLNGWAEEAGAHMTQAADRIPGTPQDAPDSQTEALNALDRIYNILAPFPPLLERSIKIEQGLVDQTSPIVETPDEAGVVYFEDLASQQERVVMLSNAMPYKAKQALEELSAQDPGALQMQGQAQGMDTEKIQEQMEGMRKALEKAIELSPRIGELAGEAAESLRAEDAAAALPKEEEALKLLKEIAESMPKQDQDQQGDQNQEQQNQEQKNQEQEQQQQQQEQQQRQERKLSREEAERLLQKAKEQEKEYRKKAAQPLGHPGKVDKDW